MGRIGWSEIMLIMIIALVVFGPNRLPEIARQVGRALREVRKVSGQFQDEVRTTFALDDEGQKSSTFPFMRGPSSPDAPPPADPDTEPPPVQDPPGAEPPAPPSAPDRQD